MRKRTTPTSGSARVDAALVEADEARWCLPPAGLVFAKSAARQRPYLYRVTGPPAGGRGGRRAGSRVPLDGGRDTKQRGEDEAVVSADLQTNEHASERDGQPADLSDILRYIEDARSFISLFRLGVREKRWTPSLRGPETHSLGATPFRGLAPYPSELNRPAGAL